MSKLIVVNNVNDTRIPFLRGMLVKSLQEAGLEFTQAYSVASDIRDELDDSDEVTTDELRERIEEILADDHPGTILRRYKKEYIYRENIRIKRENGDLEPFSRGVHAQRLQSSAIAQNKVNSITRKIHSYLIKNKIREITSHDLTQLTYSTILEEVDQQHADYYLIWRDFLKK